jgi:hypothetical protein
MDAKNCLHCSASLTPSDLAAGWCDSCGKRIPTGTKPAKAVKAVAAVPAAQDVGAPSAWPIITVLAFTALAIGGLAAIAFAR